ncbi:hypothetical protein EIP86_002078 [Pleurotus ostreatoroseus]|nr:hypothetical protein EIP86_002078 [Pleurotus ostreatoroseus]
MHSVASAQDVDMSDDDDYDDDDDDDDDEQDQSSYHRLEKAYKKLREDRNCVRLARDNALDELAKFKSLDDARGAKLSQAEAQITSLKGTISNLNAEKAALISRQDDMLESLDRANAKLKKIINECGSG